jgi:hypothetical protein
MVIVCVTVILLIYLILGIIDVNVVREKLSKIGMSFPRDEGDHQKQKILTKFVREALNLNFTPKELEIGVKNLMVKLVWYSLKDAVPVKSAVTNVKCKIIDAYRKIGKNISNILPESHVNITEIKSEVWSELSAVYYKYEDSYQKKAFREVMLEISESITDGKWDSVYRKLYRKEQTGSSMPMFPSISVR